MEANVRRPPRRAHLRSAVVSSCSRIVRQRQPRRGTLLHSREGRPSFYPTAAVQHRPVLALYRAFGQSKHFSLARSSSSFTFLAQPRSGMKIEMQRDDHLRGLGRLSEPECLSYKLVLITSEALELLWRVLFPALIWAANSGFGRDQRAPKRGVRGPMRQVRVRRAIATCPGSC